MTQPTPTTVGALLVQARQGDRSALGQLFPIVYEQLRQVAHRQRQRHAQSETLNTTALVHEAYFKLVGQESISFQDRAHLLAVAATAMRQILIDYARRRSAAKRGGGVAALSFEDIEAAVHSRTEFSDPQADALLALDRALDRLGQQSERQRRVVECRFFAGMSIEETAEALGISPATVKRAWALAQAWLFRELQTSRE